MGRALKEYESATKKQKEYERKVEKHKANLRALVDEITTKYNKKLVKEYNKACKKAIDEFYASYDPHLYSRRDSLYDMYKINLVDDGIEITLDSSFMLDVHHTGGDTSDINEYIYDITVHGGWHGGANKGEGHPAPGTPYYRTYNLTEGTHEAKNGLHLYHVTWVGWDRPAERYTPILELIQNNVDDVEQKIQEQAQAEFDRKGEIIVKQYLRTRDSYLKR